jgi:hypothetical protein
LQEKNLDGRADFCVIEKMEEGGRCGFIKGVVSLRAAELAGFLFCEDRSSLICRGYTGDNGDFVI